ncbi:MAG: hypothetical protein A2Y33_12075 [Spirochaetes bacterium GWF1_51_8]|nr:MAG: hypothetical protein A2Y33_12075 [Spirochaetes bacterium GWF1_51_8]
MKKSLALLIILFTVSSFVFAGNYDDFVKAWAANDYSKALLYIEKAYAEKPGDQKITYWYAMALYRNKKYDETITVLKKLPPAYDPLIVNWYIGDCLRKTGKTQESAGYLVLALSAPDNTKKFKQSVFGSLIDTYIKISNTQGLDGLSGDYLAYIEANPEINAGYMNYRFASYFQGVAVQYGTNGKKEAGVEWNKKSAQFAGYGMGDYAKYYDPFGYAYGFVKAKMYSDAYGIFTGAQTAIPSLKYLWNYTEVLKNLGLTNKGIALLKTGLKNYTKSENDAIWLKSLYRSLILLCAFEKDTQTYELFEKEIADFFAKNPSPDYAGAKYAAASMYMKLGFEKTGTKDAQVYLAKSIAAGKGLDQFKDALRPQDIRIVLDAEKFWAQNAASMVKSAYRMKFLYWVWGESSGVWTDAGGITKTVNKKFNPACTNEIYRSFMVFRTVYFYFTGGKVLPEIEIVLLTNRAVGFSQITNNSKLTGADGKPVEEKHAWRPVDGTNSQYPWMFLATNINRYDVFVTVFPFDAMSGFAICGPLQIVPLIKNGAYRGAFVMTDLAFSQPWTTIHEFFHNIENIYREPVKAKFDLVIHLYKDVFKKYWPSWYKGQGELFYYEYVFRNFLKTHDKEFQLLHLKETPDTTPLWKYGQYWSYFKKETFPAMWEANKLKTAGLEYYKNGDTQKAQVLLEKSFKIFPYFKDGVEFLGKIYYNQKDYANAKKYLFYTLEIAETNQSVLTLAAYCCEQTGELDKSLEMHMLAYDAYGKKSQNLYYAAKSLFTLKRFAESAEYLEKLIAVHQGDEYWQNAVNLLANLYVYQSIDYQKAKKLMDNYYTRIKEEYLLKTSTIYYAIALGETGSKKEALKLLETAKKYGADPKTVEFYRKKYQK